MEMLCWILGGTIGVLAIPAITSFLVEGAWRGRWRVEDSREADLTVEGQGAFRAATVRATLAAVTRDRAPGVLRGMAFSCWLLGQMVLPGFLVWCVGLLVLGESRHGIDPIAPVMMVAFFPGAWCAWLLWQAGSSLVRGERDRADRATHRAAVVIVSYNALVIVAAGIWLHLHQSEFLLWGCLSYAVVSIGHAVAVRACFLLHRENFPVEHAQP